MPPYHTISKHKHSVHVSDKIYKAHFAYLNKMALSGVQKPHVQDYGAQSLLQIPHDPETFVKH